ncbi:MAG: endonuclease III [Chloroflexi bacterium]|nr:endonuclease III [Chloroflexota bacterium]
MSPSTVVAATREASPTLDRARRAQARRVVRALRETYPDADCELRFSTPLELLVATILSAQCTDVRVNQVTTKLFQKYRSAADYASSSQEELEDDIRTTGFFRQKAWSIRRTAQILEADHRGEVPPAMEQLLKLPGVARKTANVVLGTAFGIASGVVVDTHIKRLTFRMDLTDETDPIKVENDLVKLIPRKDWVWFGHATIWHGRRVCFARKPACGTCSLNSFCPRRGV